LPEIGVDPSMTAETKSCPSCAVEVRLEALRCASCGAALPCGYCGWKHDVGDGPAEGVPCFGRHLVRAGHIDEAQLLRALDEQRRAQETLGAIALRYGMLSTRQVLRILDAQRERKLPFGQLAIDMGLLEHRDVMVLLAVQRDGRARVGEVCVQLGFLDAETLHRELALFRGC
jgi:hypothetical protein